MLKYALAALAAVVLGLTPTTVAHAETLLRSGDPITISSAVTIGVAPVASTTARCTLGPIIIEDIALTAEHCGPVGARVFSHGKDIGEITRDIPGRDIAVIRLRPGHAVEPIAVMPPPQPGSAVSKQGATTGFTKGVVLSSVRQVSSEDSGLLGMLGIPDPLGLTRKMYPTLAFITSMPADHGDSGAAVLNENGQAVGVLSAIGKDQRGRVVSAVVPISDIVGSLS